MVQKWRPDFDPLNDKISRMAVWIRILDLPVKYYKEFALQKIGGIIGPVIKWVQEGDRNTKFFHLTTMVRRRRNMIDGLYDTHGTWCDNHEAMKLIAKNFFQDLFAAKERPDTRFNIPLFFPEVDCHQTLNLHVEIMKLSRRFFYWKP